MGGELDKARRSASQDRDPDAYVVRLRDLRVALAEVDRLTAALAEAEATIANERGEGEPPDPRFVWRPGQGYAPQWVAADIRWPDGCAVVVTRCLPARWTFNSGRTSHPTARAAMRAALTATEKP